MHYSTQLLMTNDYTNNHNTGLIIIIVCSITVYNIAYCSYSVIINYNENRSSVQ